MTNLGFLGCIFVTLKLCGVLDWSWWIVTMPFWFWLAVLLGGTAVGALVLGCRRIGRFVCNPLRSKG